MKKFNRAKIETVDVTSTWTVLMPEMLEVLENKNSNEELKQIIREELYELAKFIDRVNKTNKDLRNMISSGD